MCIVVVVLCVLLSHVYCCTVWALLSLSLPPLSLSLDAGLLARSQYSEGPATCHLDTGFSCFPCA